jgi:DNA-binding NtrC family response regulator
VQCKTFDAVLLDLNYSRDTTSGQEGLSLLSEIKELSPYLPVVVMTAFANMGIALDASSKAMKPVLDLISRIAKTDTNVMITGEHGTGKGVIARLIHEQSDFAGNNMVSVNI